MTSRLLLTAAFSILCAGARAQTVPDLGFHGVDVRGMDTSVQPCADFWRYANGAWLKASPIPADESEWSVNNEIDERNYKILHALLNEAAADTSAPAESITAKVGRFYKAGMNVAKINAQGVAPLLPEFAHINSVRDGASLLDEIARLHRMNINAGFAFYVNQDAKDSTREIAGLYQNGLGLPDRDYYFNTDAKSKSVRAAYIKHVARMLTLAGDVPAVSSKEAAQVMTLETQMARASMTRVQQRNPHAIYHKMTLAQVDALTPGVQYDRYFAGLGLPRPGDINVAQPAFVARVGTLARTVPLPTWKAYLRWHLVSDEAPYLSDPIYKEHFAFYSTTLNGVTAQRPRWKRVLRTVDSEIGEALGQLYVARAFTPDAKARALQMVENIEDALRADIGALTWMGADTKPQAYAKLDSLVVKVGYPDHWRDYSSLPVNAGSYVGDVLQADSFEFQRQLHKIGRPVDRTEWGMTPPTNNAYYDPSMNEIVFPAGILQPPFFDAGADDASNYGEIGATIGHEMTHGFDDAGRQFDAQGNLRDWWTKTDAANFTARAKAIVTQYAAFAPLPGLHINGELTQGENIADIGGLKIAYLALEKSLTGKPRPLRDGFTPEQRFFIAYAQSWRTVNRPDSVRVRLITDPHSTERERVLGPIADMPEFYAAFGCPAPPGTGTASVW